MTSDELKAQFDLFWNARFVAVPTLAAIVVATYWITQKISTAGIASKKGEIRLLERQIADYKDKLGPEKPSEIGARLAKLEAIYGHDWPALNEDQIKTLVVGIRGLRKRETIQVFYENDLGKTLAYQIVKAFRDADWTVGYFSRGPVQNKGIGVGYVPDAADAHKAFAEALAPLPVQYLAFHVAGSAIPATVLTVAIGVRE